MQQIWAAICLIIIGLLNSLSSRYGFSSIISGDKDILLPFSAMVFLFYPLLIYLPEAHYKFVTFKQLANATLQQTQNDQQELFPWAFFVTLLSITLCVILHRIILFERVEPEQEAIARRNAQNQIGSEVSANGGGSAAELYKNNVEYKMESQVVKYFLSIAIGLQNIASAFYIVIGQNKKILSEQLLILFVFSLIVNFAYGYMNGWTAVSKILNTKLTIYINSCLFVQNNYIMLILPCVCCGLMIYCSTLICLPALFSNGQNHTQDKFRYGSIFTSLLITVIYHPFCYILRV